jgi:hypothetical protein
MTPEDKQRSTELKKQRLATMDQLVSMRRK